MWFRICSLLLLLPACADEVTVDVCGRGDQADLMAALAGGKLTVAFRDSGGHALSTMDTPVDRPVDLSTTVSGDAVSVKVTGARPDGSIAASGSAPLLHGGETCVCVALTSQQTASCSGLICRVENGQCAFYDLKTGAPAGTRTILLGENDADNLNNVTTDTYLINDSTHIGFNYGSAKSFSPDGSPPQTSLLRFELTGIPRTAVIEKAVLSLQEIDTGGANVEFYRVLEDWDEGRQNGSAGYANWNSRKEGVAWTVPGCGYTDATHRSRENEALGSMPATEGKHTLDVTDAVAGWVAMPATNFGFALTLNNSDGTDFNSREATSTSQRPEVSIQYHLP
jgi:hypothetical protein